MMFTLVLAALLALSLFLLRARSQVHPGIAVALVATAFFVATLEDVIDGGWLLNLDGPTAGLVAHIQTPSVTRLASFVTATGSSIAILFVGIALVGFLAVKGKRVDAVRVAVASVALELGLFTVKEIVARPRPVAALGLGLDPGFPSGHTANAVYFAILVIALARRHLPHGPGRVALMLVFGTWALLVGTSRLVLGVHYATDILGSASLAVTFGALALAWPFKWRGAATTPRAT